MANFLDNATYASFKGANVLADAADEFHSKLDDLFGPPAPPPSSDSLTNPLGAQQPAPIPPDASAAVPPASPAIPLPQVAASEPSPTPPVPAPAIGNQNPTGLIGDTSGLAPLPAATPDAPLSGDWLNTARAQLGKPYIWGSAGGRSDFTSAAAGFDCSGFVSYVYKNAFGINLPAQTASAYAATKPITQKDAQPGDIVEFNMDSNDPHQQHIGIYLGDGKVIQAGGTRSDVNIGKVDQFGPGTFEFRRATGAPTPKANASAVDQVAGLADHPAAQGPSGTPAASANGVPADSTNPLDKMGADFHSKLDDILNGAGQAKDQAGTNLQALGDQFHAKLDDLFKVSNDGTGLQSATGEPYVGGPARPDQSAAVGHFLTEPQPWMQNVVGAQTKDMQANAGISPFEPGAQQLTQPEQYAQARGITTGLAQTLAPEDLIARATTTGAGSLAKSADVAGNLLQSRARGEVFLGGDDPLAMVARYSAEDQAGINDFVQKMQAAGVKPAEIGDTIRQWMTENPPPPVAKAAAAPAELTPMERALKDNPPGTAPAPRAPLPAEPAAPSVPAPAVPEAAAPTVASPALPAVAANATLPAALAKSNPRYAIGPNQFQLQFANDTDKALFIVAQKTPSKADEQFMAFLRDQFPNKSDAEIRQMGTGVRSEIKTAAQTGDPSQPLRIAPSQTVANSDLPATATAPAPSGYARVQQISQDAVDTSRGKTVAETPSAETFYDQDGNIVDSSGKTAPYQPTTITATGKTIPGTGMSEGSAQKFGHVWEAPSGSPPSVTDDMVQAAHDRIDAALGKGDQDTLDQAHAGLNDLLAKRANPGEITRFMAGAEGTKAGATSILRTVRTGSLAGGVQTEAKVAFSPVIQVAMRAPVAAIKAIVTGHAGDIPNGWRGGLEGLAEGASNALQTVKYGTNYEAALTGGASGVGFKPGIDVLGQNRLTRGLGTAAIGLVRTHGAIADISAGIGRGAARATGATPEAAAATGQQWAMRSGNYGSIGGAVAKAFDQLKATNPALDVAGQIIIPFYRVAYNTLTQGVERSPVGALGTAYDVARSKLPAAVGPAMRGPYAAGADASHVTPLGDRVANNLFGIGLAAGGIGLAGSGNLTGDKPQGGAPKWSIQVGGQWVPIRAFGPLGEALSQSAALYEAARDGNGDVGRMATQTAQEYVKHVYDETWVGDLGNILIGAYEFGNGSAARLGSLAGNIGKSLVPQGTLGGQIKNAVAPAPVSTTVRSTAPLPARSSGGPATRRTVSSRH